MEFIMFVSANCIADEIPGGGGHLKDKGWPRGLAGIVVIACMPAT
jgi:hypothetical protein